MSGGSKSSDGRTKRMYTIWSVSEFTDEDEGEEDKDCDEDVSSMERRKRLWSGG